MHTSIEGALNIHITSVWLYFESRVCFVILTSKLTFRFLGDCRVECMAGIRKELAKSSTTKLNKAFSKPKVYFAFDATTPKQPALSMLHVHQC